MGYYQFSSKRKWYDPVSGSWKQDRNKWVPTKKPTTLTEPVFIPKTEPYEPPRMEIEWAYGSVQAGYYERQECIKMAANENVVIDQIPAETDAYNIVIPLAPGYESIPDPEILNAGLGSTLWEVKTNTEPNIQLPIYPDWESAQQRALSPPYWAVFQNSSQFIPLGHKTDPASWTPNDPNGNPNALQWPFGPVVLINWEKLNVEVDGPGGEFVTGEVTAKNTWIDPVSKEVFNLSARFPFCLYPLGATLTPVEPTDTNFFRWNYEGTSEPNGGGTEVVDDIYQLAFSNDQTVAPTCAQTQYEHTFTENVADGQVGIWHRWGYRDTLMDVQSEVVGKQVFGDFGGNPDALLSETELRNFDVYSQLDAGQDLHTWGPDQRYVVYTHIYEVINSQGRLNCMIATVRYNRTTTAVDPPLTFPLDACWNSNINYNRQLALDAANEVGTYNSNKVQLWTHPGGNLLPWITLERPTVTTGDASSLNGLVISADGVTTRWPFFCRGDTAPTPWVYIPVWKRDDPEITQILFGETRFRNVTDDTSYSGSPRTVTWSVCGENGEGDVVNGQWNFLQAQFPDWEKTFDTTGGVAAWEALPEGLHYIKMNWNALPNGSVFDNTRQAQWFQCCTGTRPTNAELGYIDASATTSTPQFTSNLSTYNSTGNGFFNGILEFDVPDIYPGDNGRSINVYFRGNIDVRRVGAATYETWNGAYGFILGGNRYWQIWNGRDFYDPASKKVRIECQNVDTRFIGGITYIKKV